MRDTMSPKEISESYIFATIVCVEGDNGPVESFVHK